MARSRPSATSVLLAAAALALGGCTSVADATRDATALREGTPEGLGRTVRVAVTGADEPVAATLLAALHDELVERDLFDHVQADAAAVGSSARLDVTLVSATDEELFDAWRLQSAFVVRRELDLTLRDGAGAVVLEGHVSGVAADTVTGTRPESDAVREDMAIAALHDAALKVARALRRTADARARRELESVRPVRLAPGVGPAPVAVLGFEDAEGTRVARGPALARLLADALGGLGPDLPVVPRAAVERALALSAVRRLDGLTPLDVERLDLPTARLLVVGQVSLAGGSVTARVRVLDRAGERVLEVTHTSHGLGALRVVAAALARLIGAGLVERLR